MPSPNIDKPFFTLRVLKEASARPGPVVCVRPPIGLSWLSSRLLVVHLMISFIFREFAENLAGLGFL